MYVEVIHVQTVPESIKVEVSQAVQTVGLEQAMHP
jgi:hypothetical protein